MFSILNYDPHEWTNEFYKCKPKQYYPISSYITINDHAAKNWDDYAIPYEFMMLGLVCGGVFGVFMK